MNFKDILDSDAAWENFEDKDSQGTIELPLNVEYNKVRIDEEIDLHGMTVMEAGSALDLFFKRAQRMGYEKVLIIHGKGNHSSSGGVLRSWIKTYLDKCSAAGRRGQAERSRGGSGATWVMIKNEITVPGK